MITSSSLHYHFIITSLPLHYHFIIPSLSLHYPFLQRVQREDDGAAHDLQNAEPLLDLVDQLALAAAAVLVERREADDQHL